MKISPLLFAKNEVLSDSSPVALQYRYSDWQTHLVSNLKFALSQSAEAHRRFSHEKWNPACCWHFASNPQKQELQTRCDFKTKLCSPAKTQVPVLTESYRKSSTSPEEGKLCRLYPALTPRSGGASPRLLVQGICEGKGSLSSPACQGCAQHRLSPSGPVDSPSTEGTSKLTAITPLHYLIFFCKTRSKQVMLPLNFSAF